MDAHRRDLRLQMKTKVVVDTTMDGREDGIFMNTGEEDSCNLDIQEESWAQHLQT